MLLELLEELWKLCPKSLVCSYCRLLEICVPMGGDASAPATVF